ncbi:glycosyltransferase family 4 protein [Nocardioides sp. 503]|uniref:glycosyltransferase family 4 protein n=1 Tax=Nocardioides sp. 503 TaxID=2508326 RepID=UPI001431B0BF|nr:glycosyltransferase family 4 protein [Nocardioides sp. 503]
MTRVLLLSSKRRSTRLYAEAVEELRALGAEVRLVTMSRTVPPEVGLDGVRSLWSASEGYEPDFWRSTAFAPVARRMWTYVKHDEWTLEQARQADLLVAVDPSAIYAVWQLASTNPAALARSGVYAALRALREGATPESVPVPTPVPVPVAGTVPDQPTPEPPRRQGLLVSLRAARPRRRAAVVVPEAPAPPEPGARARTESARVVALLAAGSRTEALALQDRLGPTFKNRRARADFHGIVAAYELGSGRTPPRLLEAARAELGHADAQWEAGRTKPAVASYLQAVRLLFYPGVHFDSVASPLSADPHGFASVLADSALHRALSVPRGRARPAAALPTDRGPRVLVVVNGNTNFVSEFASRLHAERGAEVRYLTPEDLGGAAHYVRDGTPRLLHSLLTDELVREEAEEVLRPHLDWADVVLAEWCTSMALFLTLVDPGDARVVVRLHSFEGWTKWPHLLDVSRVDEVVYVGEHLRELVEAVVPRMGPEDGPVSAVANNVVDLRRFELPKHPDVRHTLAMVGYAGVAKDVRWTLELLRRLRAHDSRYRLLLFGEDLPETGTAIYREYERHYRSEVAELEALGAVERRGRTVDVPEALREVGVIVSSSVRESEHMAVKEGAASGAVALVRDWPFFEQQQCGARTTYPASWVVGSLDEAVERVLAVTADEQVWSQESAVASGTALTSWDADVTAPHLARVLLG